MARGGSRRQAGKAKEKGITVLNSGEVKEEYKNHNAPIYPKTYALTAVQGAQNPHQAEMYGQSSKAGAPHKEFLEGLEKYCTENEAETIIQAIQGSYVGEIELAKYFRERAEEKKDVFMETARFRRLLAQRRKEKAQRTFHPHYKHYFWGVIPDTKYPQLNFRRLNSKIGVVEVQTPSQNEDPTTGNKDLTQDYFGISIIMPHTKQRLVSVAKDVGGKHPRLELSTGVCNYPNYNETNQRGKKARRHHQLGFCAVDVLDNNLYLPRLVPARADGTFIDMGIQYSPGKDPKQARTAALILGDMHVPFQDPLSTEASLEMAQYFKPKEIYIHDLIDFNSINHHQWGDNIFWALLAEKAKKEGVEWDSLEMELSSGLSFLRELSDVAEKSQIYVVPSNHDQFLYKFINSSEHLYDRKNTGLVSLIRGKYIRKGMSGENPMKTGLEVIGTIPKNVTFLELTDDKRPWGYECSSHGHLGVSGSKGSLRSFRVSYGRTVIGHTHNLEVDGHAISVGTNSQIPLEYQKGSPSRWLHGNAVIYDGGLAQALPIINGLWKK